MKPFFIRMLAAAGLVPASRYAQSSQRVETLSDELRAWKKRAARAAQRTTELEKRLDQRGQLLKTTRAAAARQHSELAAMQFQLENAHRSLVRTREHLIAIEVKLDILEGAANVLDARTRVVAQRQPGASGAPV